MGCFHSDHIAVSCMLCGHCDTKLVTAAISLCFSDHSRQAGTLSSTSTHPDQHKLLHSKTFIAVKSSLKRSYKVDVIAHKTLDALWKIVTEITPRGNR